MDNFMDKLAQRMSANELIKANSAAEAMELRRLQEQLADYETILQETRKLNLKNSELTDQTRELVSVGLADIRKILNETNAEKDREKEKQVSEYSNIEEELSNIKEKLSKAGEDLTLLQQSLEEKSKQDQSSDELMNKIEDFVHKENVKVYRNVQAVVVDNLKAQTDEIQTANEKAQKRFGGMKPLLIIAIVAVAADIVIGVCTILLTLGIL